MKKVSLFMLSLLTYILIDNLWINLVMKSFYDAQIGALRNLDVSYFQIGCGALVWALLTLGLFMFVLPGAKTYKQVVLGGALFGAIVYGVYDLTNYVALVHWPLSLVLIDWAWGVFVNALMAAFIFHSKKRFKITQF